jgi:hypothetical protein
MEPMRQESMQRKPARPERPQERVPEAWAPPEWVPREPPPQELVPEEAGVGSRSRCVAGDFFAGVPAGGDLYLLKSVPHDWDDEAYVAILRSCRRAMAEGARLLVLERVVPPGNAPSESKLFDINVLVVAGRAERTEAEHRALFRRAGFGMTRLLPTRSPLTLLEGAPLPDER